MRIFGKIALHGSGNSRADTFWTCISRVCGSRELGSKSGIRAGARVSAQFREPEFPRAERSGAGSPEVGYVALSCRSNVLRRNRDFLAPLLCQGSYSRLPSSRSGARELGTKEFINSRLPSYRLSAPEITPVPGISAADWESKHELAVQPSVLSP